MIASGGIIIWGGGECIMPQFFPLTRTALREVVEKNDELVDETDTRCVVKQERRHFTKTRLVELRDRSPLRH